MVTLVNRAKMTTATIGTGDIDLGLAVDGYQTFADAGVSDGDVVPYVVEDGSAWEIGTGTYTASGTTLTRTVSESSNAGSAINLSGDAVVFVMARAEYLEALAPLESPTLTGTPTAPTADPETNTTQIATTAFVEAVKVALRDGVDPSLDTFQKLVTAFGAELELKADNEPFSAGTVTGTDLDISTGNSFNYALTSNDTITFSNIPAGAFMWHLTATATGTRTWTLPTLVEMGDDTALDPPADGETKSLTFWTYDGGTTIYGGASK